MRIYILGGLGSGKTYLARELSKRNGIKHTNLDKLYYNNPKEKVQLLNKILTKKNWIIEGHWFTWSKKGLDKAEKIIFLDVPLWRRDLHLILRYFKRMFGLEPGRKLRLRDLNEMFKLNHEWKEKNAKSALSRYKHKVFIFRTADKLLEYLHNI